jgi:hypothetical protein
MHERWKKKKKQRGRKLLISTRKCTRRTRTQGVIPRQRECELPCQMFSHCDICLDSEYRIEGWVQVSQTWRKNYRDSVCQVRGV